MNTIDYLTAFYERFGAPDFTNFAPSDLNLSETYKFGAFILATQEGRVVLIRRKPIDKYPGIENFWWIPGGGQEGNETLDETAVREFREETGMGVTVERALLAQVATDRPFIAVIFRGTVTDGTVSAGADPDNITAEARAFAPKELTIHDLWMDTCKILLAKEGFVDGNVDQVVLNNGLRQS